MPTWMQMVLDRTKDPIEVDVSKIDIPVDTLKACVMTEDEINALRGHPRLTGINDPESRKFKFLFMLTWYRLNKAERISELDWWGDGTKEHPGLPVNLKLQLTLAVESALSFTKEKPGEEKSFLDNLLLKLSQMSDSPSS